MQDIDIRATADASPDAVWRLLDDSATWPDWTPIDSFELVSPAGPSGLGEVRVFHNGRYTLREQIVERRERELLGYTVLGGLAVRDYLARIELTARPDGKTDLRWHTTFRPAVPGTGWLYRRALHTATQAFVDGLARAATAADRSSDTDAS